MIKKLAIIAILHGGASFLPVVISAILPHGPGPGDAAAAFLFVGLGGFAYLLPGYVAAFRNAPRFAAILGLNFVAGWTCLGWIATLIWSFVDTKKTNPQIIIQHMYTTPQTPPPINQQTK